GLGLARRPTEPVVELLVRAPCLRADALRETDPLGDLREERALFEEVEARLACALAAQCRRFTLRQQGPVVRPSVGAAPRDGVHQIFALRAAPRERDPSPAIGIDELGIQAITEADTTCLGEQTCVLEERTERDAGGDVPNVEQRRGTLPIEEDVE